MTDFSAAVGCAGQETRATAGLETGATRDDRRYSRIASSDLLFNKLKQGKRLK
jgi:hypothetical protein